jgi:hypothetical protein
MIAFDKSGKIKWSVPNDSPQIATADNGVIGASGITYDSNGRATGQIAMPTQSWTGRAYTDGDVRQVVPTPIEHATSYAAVNGGNPSAAASPVASSTYVPSLGSIYRAKIAELAKGYVGNSTKWQEESGGTTCNIFVRDVLAEASDDTQLEIPFPVRPGLSWYQRSYTHPFLAADWAKTSMDGGCWKPLPAGPDGALPGDVLATGWPANGHDGTGHVGIVVDPSLLVDPNFPHGLTVRFASAASEAPYWIIDAGARKAFIKGTITLTDYGYRLPKFDFTNPQNVQGLKQDSHVRRFSCY